VLKELIQGYGSVYPPDDDAFGGLLVGTWEGSWTEQGALASHGDVQDNASLGCPRGELVDRPLRAVRTACCRVNSTTLQSSSDRADGGVAGLDGGVDGRRRRRPAVGAKEG
jgi:hypothetical protein